jgi:drug/metabolite transporter (DMT)-like permease
MNMLWFFLALLTAVSEAAYVTTVKTYIQRIPVILYLVVTHICMLGYMLVALLITDGFPQHIPVLIFLFLGITSVMDAITFPRVLAAIKQSDISLLAPLTAFNPLFTVVFAWIGLQEMPTAVHGVGILLIVLGSYLLHITEVRQGILKPFEELIRQPGAMLYLSAMFVWALTPVLQKKAILLTVPESPLFVSFVNISLSTLYLLPILFFVSSPQTMISVTRRFYPVFIVLGFLLFTAQYASYTAFSLAPVAYVRAIIMLSSIFTIVAGRIVYREGRIRERVVGAVPMIGGALLLMVS